MSQSTGAKVVLLRGAGPIWKGKLSQVYRTGLNFHDRSVAGVLQAIPQEGYGNDPAGDLNILLIQIKSENSSAYPRYLAAGIVYGRYYYYEQAYLTIAGFPAQAIAPPSALQGPFGTLACQIAPQLPLLKVSIPKHRRLKSWDPVK